MNAHQANNTADDGNREGRESKEQNAEKTTNENSKSVSVSRANVIAFSTNCFFYFSLANKNYAENLRETCKTICR